MANETPSASADPWRPPTSVVVRTALCLFAAAFSPPVIMVSYLCATEFPQRHQVDQPPGWYERARGSDATDQAAGVAAFVTGACFVLLTPIPMLHRFFVLALYTPVMFWLLFGVSIEWDWYIGGRYPH